MAVAKEQEMVALNRRCAPACVEAEAEVPPGHVPGAARGKLGVMDY
jgi:uncharacterized protein YqfA (UPF0365 family)